MKWVTASATKVPEPQAGVQDGLIHRVSHHLADHCAGEPVGCVVFAQLTAFVRRDDRFVEDGGDVVGGLLPVEAGDAAGEGLDEGQAAIHLGGPGEEVGLHHALQARLAAELAPVEEVGGVGFPPARRRRCGRRPAPPCR